MAPTLALHYDSSAGDLEAGVGWSLGLPTITRTGPTGLVRPLYEDPNFGGRVTSNSDRFSYNGSALVPICLIENSGCTTDAGAEYEGPMPSFTSGGGWHYYRLQAENGETLRFFWSPDHLTWVIQSKNGNIEELGIPLDRNYDATNGVDLELLQGSGPGGYPPPTAPFRWNLVRQYDANRLAKSHTPANPIVYTWTGIGRRHTLSDVYYSGPLTPWPALAQYVHHVHFTYNENYGTYAPQNSPTWRSKSLSTISEIDVTSANVAPANGATRYLDRRYHLTQTPDHDHFLLTSYQLEGRCSSPVAELANGLLPATNCPPLPATTLSYSPSAPQSAPTAQTIWGAGTTDQFTNHTTYPIDLNNDGLPDLISAPPVDPCLPYLYGCLSAGGSTFQQCFDQVDCNAPTQDLYLNGAFGQVASLAKSTISVELGDGWTDARQDNIVPGSAWNTFTFDDGYLTPNVRAFAGDFYGDGRSNLLTFDAQVALDGRNGCDFQSSNQWNGLNYVFNAPSEPSQSWTLNVQNVDTLMLPNTLDFAWLGSADFDGDGYTDRMTWRQQWQEPITPAVCYSQNDAPNGPDAVGVEFTQRSAAGIVNPFSVGTLPPGQGQTQAYSTNISAACNDTFAPWMIATHENLQTAYDAYEDGSPTTPTQLFGAILRSCLAGAKFTRFSQSNLEEIPSPASTRPTLINPFTPLTRHGGRASKSG